MHVVCPACFNVFDPDSDEHPVRVDCGHVYHEGCVKGEGNCLMCYETYTEDDRSRLVLETNDIDEEDAAIREGVKKSLELHTSALGEDRLAALRAEVVALRQERSARTAGLDMTDSIIEMNRKHNQSMTTQLARIKKDTQETRERRLSLEEALKSAPTGSNNVGIEQGVGSNEGGHTEGSGVTR